MLTVGDGSGYAQNKISENVECEIMQVVMEEAREAYDENIIQELPSDTVAQMEANADRIRQWAEEWCKDNPATSTV